MTNEIRTLDPEGKRLQSNGTHIAIWATPEMAQKHTGEIQIWTRGMEWDNEDGTTTTFAPELCWTIPEEDADDLFAIFERLDENNRCNVAEANAALGF